ncbi:SDR family oxidoreductase [Planctomicrobium sp. SH661]|uniref:SDR family oxidoreductase n=1 Tax=Planctomicrobium sp. SH661 TaxID=3448124 RepID=UPI003F5CB70C
MEVRDTVAIVTGGANGIGKAICRALANAGARHVMVADLDVGRAQEVAKEIGGTAVQCDVSQESAIQRLVSMTEEAHGGIDLLISNAGITTKGGPEVPDADWLRLWNVNLMAHVYAARAALPKMLERGHGYFVQVASAAGILTEIGSAPYSVTKHAAVSFAEWLSVHYQKQGIRVSCVCPAGVATDFLDMSDPVHQFLHMNAVTPEVVADCILQGIHDEQFLLLPHPEIGEFFAFKTQDYDRWLKQFARINEKLQKKMKKLQGAPGETDR